MQRRRVNDMQMKTAAVLARAKASAQSSSNVRRMFAENQRRVAAMSPEERQQVQDRLRQTAEEAMARRARITARPTNDEVTNAPTRGLTHYARTVGNRSHSRQPSNTTSTHRQPVANAVVQHQSYLRSSGELRDATTSVLQQHG